jgi:hypothetical protein
MSEIPKLVKTDKEYTVFVSVSPACRAGKTVVSLDDRYLADTFATRRNCKGTVLAREGVQDARGGRCGPYGPHGAGPASPGPVGPRLTGRGPTVIRLPDSGAMRSRVHRAAPMRYR